MDCPKCKKDIGQRGEKGALLDDKAICCYCWIKIDKERHGGKQKFKHKIVQSRSCAA